MLAMSNSNSPMSPSRNILRKGHRNFAHFFPSLKNGVSIGCESYLEAECCYLLEHDREITRYFAQPKCYEWMEAEKKFRYTPDFLVRCSDDSSYLIEVKHSFIHLEEAYQEKLDSFSLLCRNRAMYFHQWSRAKIHSHSSLSTLKQLYSRSHHIDTADSYFFIEAAKHIAWPVTLAQLIHQLPQFSINLLCHLLFYQVLQADLSQPLTLDFLIDGIECYGRSVA